MVQVSFKSTAAGRGQSIIGFWEAALEVLIASNVTGFFELSGMNAKVSVGGAEQTLEIIEAQGLIDGKGADNSESHAFVNQAIESRCESIGSQPADFLKVARVTRFTMTIF